MLVETIFKKGISKEDLLESLKRRVKKIKKEFGAIRNKEIAVAVSGGKDSSALAFILKEMGYDLVLYHIDLGIGDFSKKSREAAASLADFIDAELIIEPISNYGIEIRRLGPLPPCSVCGVVKRYLTNKFAYENGLEIATAHVLDDMLAFIAKAIVAGDKNQMARLKPYLEAKEEFKIAARSKPLALVAEIETKQLVEEFKVPYTDAICPNSRKAATNRIKEKYLKALGYKEVFNFVYGALRIAASIKEEGVPLRKCKRCGFATTSEICKFCRIREAMSK